MILPALIFFARIIDVSLGTMRIIFTSRGLRKPAPLLGFIEVFIWIVATSQLVKHAQNIIAYLFYAAGFAAGNYVGMYLENKLAIGMLTVRAIIRRDPTELSERLRQAGFGLTLVDGQGSTGKVKLIYTTIKRRDLPAVTALFHEILPGAFLAIEEVRSAELGIFPAPQANFARQLRKKK
ncbi:MAG: DUF2179 domain-containing protein [Chloroflexota bacterium]